MVPSAYEPHLSSSSIAAEQENTTQHHSKPQERLVIFVSDVFDCDSYRMSHRLKMRKLKISVGHPRRGYCHHLAVVHCLTKDLRAGEAIKSTRIQTFKELKDALGNHYPRSSPPASAVTKDLTQIRNDLLRLIETPYASQETASSCKQLCTTHKILFSAQFLVNTKQ
jgi:hypothetical protein